MTDWRQIQARIRKAKNSPDAHAKLSELFQRTRDGMVAWELGVIEEKAARTDEAVKWYTIAAERFRRAEWKKKAQEALVRLGAPVPVEAAQTNLEGNHLHTNETIHSDPEREAPKAALPLAYGEIPEASESDDVETVATPAAQAAGADSALAGKKKRRRGRRGGRGRRRKDASAPPALPNQAFAQSVEEKPAPPAPETFRHQEARPVPVQRPVFAPPIIEASRPAPIEAAAPALQLPSERTAHGRAGDPALASRMAQLESMLRRLVSSPLHRLDDVDHAPAGPGVFLLSDSDQITSYYIEACQTLRVGLGNLARGNRGGKPTRGVGRGYSESGLKSKLAEHLGINESKVSQYMKDHCVVRWIQLDDDAPHLAHFAIGVLRTPLNLD
jgi:hypothetical protein